MKAKREKKKRSEFWSSTQKNKCAPPNDRIDLLQTKSDIVWSADQINLDPSFLW